MLTSWVVMPPRSSSTKYIIYSDILSFKSQTVFSLKVHSTGELLSMEDIISVTKLFNDDLILNNLSHLQLTLMSWYMGLNAFGMDNFLHGAIRSRLLQFHRDNQVIFA